MTMKKKLKLKNLSQEQKYNLATGGLAALLVGGTATLVQLLGTQPASYDDVDMSDADDMIDNDMPMVDPVAEDVIIEEPIDVDVIEDVIEVDTDLDIVEYDSPSFAEAFSAARSAHGPGHIFEYNGSNYTTYYAEEIDAMSPEVDDAFTQEVVASVETIPVELAEATESDYVDVQADDYIDSEADSQPEMEDSDDIVAESDLDTEDSVADNLHNEDEPDVLDVDDNDVVGATTAEPIVIDNRDFFDDAFGDASEQIVSSSASEYSGDIASVDLEDIADPSVEDNTLYADASDTVSADGTEAFVIVDDADFEDPTFGDATSLAESSNTDGSGGTSYVDATDFDDAAFGDDPSATVVDGGLEDDYAIEEPLSVDNSEIDDAIEQIDTVEDVFEDDAFDTGL